MKTKLQPIFSHALIELQNQAIVPADFNPSFKIEHSRDKKFGDFACNLAMTLAKAAKRNPRELAQLIIDHLPENAYIEKVEIAGPGFINIFIKAASQSQIVPDILERADQFGRQASNGKKVQIEYVSANPTGPLHVGHGRGAAYGAALANLLKAAGWQVDQEYYVNDAGRQMDILATSVWLRYLNLSGEAETVFPSNGYKGDYIWDIAATLHRTQGDLYRFPIDTVYSNICADVADGGDKELHIDALIAKAKLLLADNYLPLFDVALNSILDNIRADLQAFAVIHDYWFSERSLSSQIQMSLKTLADSQHTYEKEGAIWFKSTEFGDEKDRVLVRDNGQGTYFASDIAYHHHKLARGYDKLINIWGADHHGYIARVDAALQALGADHQKMTVLLVQFASLYRGKEKLSMSTRSGQFVTLKQLREEVGTDAARFFYVMRKCEQHMDFDLELAKSKSNENPVYYIQYAHARIASVMRQLTDKNLSWDTNKLDLSLLSNEHEQSLLNHLGRYSEIIQKAAIQYEPHQIAYYLKDLATALHSYYNAHAWLVDDAPLRNARLALIMACKQVFKNGLELLGVSAPEQM